MSSFMIEEQNKPSWGLVIPVSVIPGGKTLVVNKKDKNMAFSGTTVSDWGYRRESRPDFLPYVLVNVIDNFLLSQGTINSKDGH